MPMNMIAVLFLVSAACGGLAWVFLYPILSGERKAEQRRATFTQNDPVARIAEATAARGGKSRREQIEEVLKEVDERNRKQKRRPLSVRISQAGLHWSKRTFFLVSAVVGLATFVITMLLSGSILIAGLLAFAAAFGLPQWVLAFLKKRRERKFIEHFPDTVDIIVRGIKAGLPLNDSLRIIVSDSPEPIRSEFKAIVDTQAIGMPIGEACLELYQSIPLPEANFFGIVISIQQKSGGNLSEALGNLSKVLRERKKLKSKIISVSQEAKASAAIIGALPPVVMLLVYISSPDYISLLWQTPIGRVMLACCATWMTIGVLVMRKMINFQF
jgi:tight adherence protein B